MLNTHTQNDIIMQVLRGDLSVKEGAALANRSRQTVYNWVAKKRAADNNSTTHPTGPTNRTELEKLRTENRRLRGLLVDALLAQA